MSLTSRYLTMNEENEKKQTKKKFHLSQVLQNGCLDIAIWSHFNEETSHVQVSIIHWVVAPVHVVCVNGASCLVMTPVSVSITSLTSF